MKVVDNKYRNIIKGYLGLINMSLEDIEALEEYKIDNDELDNHYQNIIGLLSDCEAKLKKYGYGERIK